MSIHSPDRIRNLKILVSALAANVLPETTAKILIASLTAKPEVKAMALAVATTFEQPQLKRTLNLSRSQNVVENLDISFESTQVSYQGENVGRIAILFKSPLPGELQAKLAIESAIDRYLEYLQKVHYIIVLEESDRHVRVFIPALSIPDFSILWKSFIDDVAFSVYGLTRPQLPGLTQTFILMLNSVTLSARGFSTLEIPILNRGQANVLSALYFSVWREAKKRQSDRQQKIVGLLTELENEDLHEKDIKSKTKQLEDAQAMQLKEENKYQEDFQKLFGRLLQEQHDTSVEIQAIKDKLSQSGLSKTESNKLQKQQDKLNTNSIFSKEFTEQKLEYLRQSGGDPFKLVDLDRQQNLDKFNVIYSIAKNFTKTATDQINGTRGDIFTKCIAEMYRLMEMGDNQFASSPPPLLTEKPNLGSGRSAGDDNKEFCYSCGVAIDSKTAEWKVLRFIFERPEQRRQSASSEGRPHICASCSALAFASPLKVTDESIILRLEPSGDDVSAKLKLKDYLRMLTNKEIHLSAGKYIVLASDKTQGGDLASQKLGQVQYALAKIAEIFPVEVLSDFNFSLIIQGSQVINLARRHLIFIKGLMDGYGQWIVTVGKDINMTLGDAIRYVQQDLPYLADYTLTKIANISNNLEMEKIRALYWDVIRSDLNLQGDFMDSDTKLAKRARLYRDVAALTGLTYAFAESLEGTAKKLMDSDDAKREVSKLIEKVDDAVIFSYFATLGDENKTSVRARLWHNTDNDFIYSQTKYLLADIGLTDREETGEDGKIWLNLYADDIPRAYTYFAEKEYYRQEKDWKELTYQLKLSIHSIP
jgi:hypothetical protein